MKDRPSTLAEVAAWSEKLEDFGMNLRDWMHTVTRGDVSNRPALYRAIEDEPPRLRDRFDQGEVADAFLAAYAEWIADRAMIARPNWTTDLRRVLERPWFANDARASLLILSPASFRQRNLFTIPENIVHLRRGRPRVSEDKKREKARLRDRRYRQRTRRLIQLGRKVDSKT